jgi:hypothetical protein
LIALVALAGLNDLLCFALYVLSKRTANISRFIKLALVVPPHKSLISAGID